MQQSKKFEMVVLNDNDPYRRSCLVERQNWTASPTPASSCFTTRLFDTTVATFSDLANTQQQPVPPT
jgi:hypothetical protein